MDGLRRDAPLALLERARSGDPDAFGQLAEEHRTALLRLCEKMTGSHEQAEDLVQDTFLKAFTRIESFELRSSLRTWLFRIAMNACLDHQRAQKPWDLEKRWQWFRENGELVQQLEQTLYLSPERSAEVKEVAATCVNCVSMSLPPKQRATITLCDQMGLSREEAAKAIGASVASVKTELHRARKTMTAVFESHCALVDGQNECDGCLVAGRIKRQGRPKKDARTSAAPRADRTRTRTDRSSDLSSSLPSSVRGASSGSAMTCDQIDELLSDLLSDELPDNARAGLETHVASCERCGDSYRALKRTVRFVRRHADQTFAPGSPGAAYFEFTSRLMQDDPTGAQHALLAGVQDLFEGGQR